MAMIVSDEVELNKVTDLAEKILHLINKNADVTHGEVLMAFLFAIGKALSSIACPDCRGLAAKNIKSELPHILRRALKYPDREPPSECIH